MTTIENFERTCRYGHGPLFVVRKDEKSAGWALVEVEIAAMPQMAVKDGLLLLNAWECPACGYTELAEFKHL